MKKISLYDFLLAIFAYVFISSIPYSYFISSEIIINSIYSVSKIAFFVGLYFYLSKKNLYVESNKNTKNSLLMVPTFIVCFSNLIVGAIQKDLIWEINYPMFVSQIILSISTAFAEELIFRYCSFNFLENKKPIIRIILSAAIFGLLHVVNFFNTFNPVALIQVIYTFGIGLILGVIFEYSGSFVLCIVFHALFNTLNNDLISFVYVGTSDITYYLVNSLVGAVAGLYLVCVYIFVFKKRDLWVE